MRRIGLYDAPTCTRVRLTIDGEAQGVYCGNRWCSGCDLPMGYVLHEGERWALRGSVVACGPVMQRSERQHARGLAIDLATILDVEEIGQLMQRWYW